MILTRRVKKERRVKMKKVARMKGKREKVRVKKVKMMTTKEKKKRKLQRRKVVMPKMMSLPQKKIDMLKKMTCEILEKVKLNDLFLFFVCTLSYHAPLSCQVKS